LTKPGIKPLQNGNITELLDAWTEGDSEALDKLIPLIMSDLRALAGRYLARERPGHTLQPTALVNEAYLKLAERRSVHLKNRVQLFAVLAQAMRRILVDHARRRRAARHGSGRQPVSLEEVFGVSVPIDVDLVDLDDALKELAAIDQRRHDVVQLSYFGGLTLDEIAVALNISAITVRRDLKTAKMWLLSALRRDE
jgi:RNA polymerase sigma factor (TIGR02999 family)